MSWEVSPSRTEVLKIGGETINIHGMSPAEIKNLIISKARELGWRRVKVTVNGVEVSPDDFENRINELRSRNENIEIVVEKLEIAG